MGKFFGVAAVIGFLFLLGAIWLGVSLVVWFVGMTFYVLTHFWWLILACAIIYFAAKNTWNEMHP
jgi:hypothetical protein